MKHMATDRIPDREAGASVNQCVPRWEPRDEDEAPLNPQRTDPNTLQGISTPLKTG